jgi:hypothetical protein
VIPSGTFSPQTIDIDPVRVIKQLKNVCNKHIYIILFVLNYFLNICIINPLDKDLTFDTILHCIYLQTIYVNVSLIDKYFTPNIHLLRNERWSFRSFEEISSFGYHVLLNFIVSYCI